MASTTTIHSEKWFRNVIANPSADALAITDAIRAVPL
jgi:hypothetical protein